MARHAPDVVVLDLGMLHLDPPAAVIRALAEEHPATRVVVHTAYRSAAIARLLLAAGAWAYVLKGETAEEIVGRSGWWRRASGGGRRGSA